MNDLAATVRGHDVATRSGTLLLDDGGLVRYAAAAFDAGGLRLLRSGQRVRVRVRVEPDGVTVAAVTLSSFDLP
jgi:hypothetical protein